MSSAQRRVTHTIRKCISIQNSDSCMHAITECDVHTHVVITGPNGLSNDNIVTQYILHIWLCQTSQHRKKGLYVHYSVYPYPRSAVWGWGRWTQSGTSCPSQGWPHRVAHLDSRCQTPASAPLLIAGAAVGEELHSLLRDCGRRGWEREIGRPVWDHTKECTNVNCLVLAYYTSQKLILKTNKRRNPDSYQENSGPEKTRSHPAQNHYMYM